MGQPANANQSAERQHLSGDQTAELVMLAALRRISARSLVDYRDDEDELRRQMHHINALARAAILDAEGK